MVMFMVFPRKASIVSRIQSFLSFYLKWWIAVPLFLFIFGLATFLYIYSIFNTETIYPGISVDGIDVGGLTRQEALIALTENLHKTIPKDGIVISTPLKEYRLPFHDIGYMPEYGKTLDMAYAQGREGNVLQRLVTIHRLRKERIQILAEMCYNVEKTIRILDSIRQDTDKPAKSATVKINNRNPEMTPHQTGFQMDIDLSMERINQSLLGRTMEDVRLCVTEITPKVTTQMVEQISSKLGEFRTYFNIHNEGRAHNIKTACSKINQKLLLPGEIFSMDKMLGERTKKNGYQPAKVIINNEMVDGLGGGICQVTSTFYNAVLLSRLEVVERRNHTLPLSYIDVGRDATISQGYIDFKFKNSSGYAILVEAKTMGEQIITTVWGRAPQQKHTVKIRTKILEKIEAEGIEAIIDPSLKPGETITIQEAKPGYKVEVYRDIIDASGKVIKTEKISVDRYQPQKRKVKIAPQTMHILQ